MTAAVRNRYFPLKIATLDYTVPLPVARTTTTERVAHAIGTLRPQLFAYQFVVAAEPA